MEWCWGPVAVCKCPLALGVTGRDLGIFARQRGEAVQLEGQGGRRNSVRTLPAEGREAHWRGRGEGVEIHPPYPLGAEN